MIYSSDYVITYKFDKESHSPSEIFSRMAELTDGFCTLDALFIKTLNEEMRSNSVLTGLEYSSIRAYIVNTLKGIDNKDIANLDWKTIIGKSLVKLKLAVIRFLDNEKPATNSDLIELQSEILEIEKATGLKEIAAYKSMCLNQLAGGLVTINSASMQISNEEQIIITTDNGDSRLSTRMVITEERRIEILTQSTEPFRDKAVVLVKKPDYLGNSMWDVIYRGRRELMKMGDLDFLMKFHDNHPDAAVRPGDSLDVDLDGVHSLGASGEVIHKRYMIRKVSKVLKNKDLQNKIFDV